MNTGKVLAAVGNITISESDVMQALASLGQKAPQYNNPQGKEMILEQLISKALILTDAKKNLLDHDPQLLAQLEALKEELLVSFYIERALKDVAVTEEEAKEYYDENPQQFAGEETMNASHILVAEKELAEEILEKLKKGELEFAEAAKKYSTCPSSESGGELGDFTTGQMVPEFDRACFELKKGELGGPVKTSFGYHIIRLNAKNAAKQLSFDEVKEKLIGKLTADKQQAAYQSKVNQLKILYPVDRSGILG